MRVKNDNPLILFIIRMSIFILVVLAGCTTKVLAPNGRVILQDKDYEIVYIERMPCVILEKDLSGHTGISCDWERWKGE